jgi:hypothetical protein
MKLSFNGKEKEFSQKTKIEGIGSQCVTQEMLKDVLQR